MYFRMHYRWLPPKDYRMDTSSHIDTATGYLSSPHKRDLPCKKLSIEVATHATHLKQTSSL